MTNIVNRMNLALKIRSNYKNNIAIPLNVTISPSDRCNLNCEMCITRYHDRKHLVRELDIVDYKKLMESLFKMGTRTIRITGGGEPLMYPEIRELLGLVKQYGFIGEMVTNGTFLDKEMILYLHLINWDKVDLSLDGYNTETHDAIRGKGVFDKIITNLKHYLELPEPKFKICMNTLKTKFNEKEFHKFNEIKEKFGVTEHSVSIPTAFDKRSEAILPNGVDKNHKKDLKHCYAPWLETFIEINGDVKLCCVHTEIMGNLKSESFEEIWNGKKYIDVREMFRKKQFFLECYQVCSIPKINYFNKIYPIYEGNPLKILVNK